MLHVLTPALHRLRHASARTALLAGIMALAASFPGDVARAQTAGAETPRLLTPADEAGLHWRSIGPAVSGGRITDIEAVPARPATLYIGAASGGVWKTTSHGVEWTPVFDEAANLSIGDIALAPSDPDVVWVGTGEANNRQSSPWGAGVYRSTDGGATWAFLGLEETRHIGRIVVHPADPDVAWVAALGHLFGPNEERGLYKTTDGGRSWRKTKHIDDHTGFVDLAMAPGDPGVLYAAAYQRERRNWGFAGGGPGSGLWRSTDGGESWHELTQGLPEGDMGRIGLAVRPGDPDLVLATVQAKDGGVFRSRDRGETWEKVNDLNPRPMYYSKIRVAPDDPDRIYVLGTQLHRSTDGGETFHEMRLEEEYNLGVHVDNHALWIDPSNPEHMYLGNDGGFYWTFDGGASWDTPANLPIQQFYDVALDMERPYNIIGGLQDNNSFRGPSATRRWHGILNRDWQVVDYGDGMYAQADPTDPATIYVASQGGALLRVDTRTGDRKKIQPVPRDTAETYRFDWMSPILVSPHDHETVYIGGNKLFISRDRGVSWAETEDLSRRIHQDSLPLMGALPDSTMLSKHDGTSAYGEITMIAESPVTPGLLWVGTDDGNVQVSRDAGATWTEVGAAVPGLPRRMHVSRVVASHHAGCRAYVSFDGHWDDDYAPWLYATEDCGASWRPLHGALESATVNVVREHPANPDALFVGAEDGVFASLDRGATWSRINGNMPRAPVDDLELHPRDGDLVAATHGRGIWILDDATPLARLTGDVARKPAHLFDVRPATLFQLRNDVPSLGHGIYRAENPPFGALLTYRLAEAAADSVTIRIRDAGGELLRTLRGPGAAGLHRVVWDLRLEPLPHDTTIFEVPMLDVGPAGPLVIAGRYAAELALGGGAGATERVSFEVVPDPAMPITAAERRARYAFTRELYALQKAGYHASVQANRIGRQVAELVDSVAARAKADTAAAAAAIPAADSALVARADSLAGVVRQAATELRAANGELRGWWRGLIGEFDGGSSTLGTMTGPTEAQERRLVLMTGRFERAIAELDRVLEQTMPELNRTLAELGRGTVQLPPRGG